MNVAVIGAGAAGCFCAAELARLRPDFQITVYEAVSRPLAKVAVTGGGRCNLTNSFADITDLAQAYPRGHRLMARLFRQFGPEDTWKWFEAAGVPLVLQEDQCVFPRSQDAMQIVRTLLGLLRERGVAVRTGRRLVTLRPPGNGTSELLVRSCALADTASDAGFPAANPGALQGTALDGGFPVASRKKLSDWRLDFEDGTVAEADAVVVTTGGSPKRSGLGFLDPLGLTVAEPVPSLFTFRIDGPIRELAGTVVPSASCLLAGTKFRASGPLLVTDWGMSGPAILKLSSYAARHLAENGYQATLLVNWLGDASDAEARERIVQGIRGQEKKLLSSVRPDVLTARLWAHLLARAELRPDLRAGELGSRGLNRLANVLTADSYAVAGRAKFKEEFVTCGGVDLSEINYNTLEAKRFHGLYFAGEVLDVDAITGGFNLQAAWTAGRVAAHSLAAR